MRSFVKLRFQGGRFEGAAFPVDVLAELAAYSDLVLEAAKVLWYAHHPSRVNAPRGFDKAFTLRLVTIEEGSAMPVLDSLDVRDQAVVGMRPHEVADYFTAGRDLVSAIFYGGTQKVALPTVLASRLPPGLLHRSEPLFLVLSGKLGNRLAAFGNRLEDEDQIQFVSPDNQPVGPSFGRKTRDWIVENVPNEYAEEVEHFGYITKADKNRNTFELKTGRRSVPFVVPPEVVPEVMTWMRDDAMVLVKGTEHRRTVGSREFLEVASIGVVTEDLDVSMFVACPLPLSSQLADIAKLEDGGLDGDGKAYTEEALAVGRSLLEAVMRYGGIPMPYVYPTAEMTFRAEWNHPARDVVMTLDPFGQRFNVLSVEVESEESSRRGYNADEIKTLASHLEKLLADEEGAS